MFKFLNNTEEAKEILNLTKAMASKDKSVSWQAQEAFAALVGPVIPQVVNQMSTSKMIYRDYRYNMGDVPHFPVDQFQANEEGLFDIWSIATEGGLATNEVYGGDDWRFRTYKLSSAVSVAKSYVEKSQLDVLASILNRLAQEILVKQEYQAWRVIMQALGESRTNGSPHVLDTTTAGALIPEDINQLILKASLLRSSWAGGTPEMTVGEGVTDLFMSPQAMAKIRALAFNPVNTVNTGVGVVALPDAVRQGLFTSGSFSEFYGKKITVLRELQPTGAFNALFDDAYTAGGGEPAFVGGTDQIILGVDLSTDSFIRAIAQDSDTGSEFTLLPDDQFLARQAKIGWYGDMEEGRICGDVKVVTGLIM